MSTLQDKQTSEPKGSDPSQLLLSSPRSLLPAFEPVSSSPALPRPPKRKLDGSPSRGKAIHQHYPTPAPTSSTALLPSSPPDLPKTRPGIQRTLSTLSERQPLGTVPTVDLPANGDAVLMGRSSNSSHYQLSANRLISRVHVSASYRPPLEEDQPASVVVQCLGWNGCKVHCRGQVYDLAKGDTFSSDKPLAEVMLDVQDARVLLRWPTMHRSGSLTNLSDATWDDDGSPRRIATPALDYLPSSPPRARIHLESPVSPSPRERSGMTAASTFLGAADYSPTRPAVEVYEDASSDEAKPSEREGSNAVEPAQVSASAASQVSSALSSAEEFSDADEENDPIVHSFGVFGDGLLPRMAAINAASPEHKRRPLRTSVSPQAAGRPELSAKDEYSPIRNHVINQLAFSRLHALPLSTIMGNLPTSMKAGTVQKPLADGSMVRKPLTDADLKRLLDETPCVGEIVREGKDAAGKTLEDEFYYVPEMDGDQGRRDAVENSLGKPGLRAVRKQHKQYFWKRPRH